MLCDTRRVGQARACEMSALHLMSAAGASIRHHCTSGGRHARLEETQHSTQHARGSMWRCARLPLWKAQKRTGREDRAKQKA